MHVKTSDQPVVDLGFGRDQCNWGLHLAGLYEKEEDRDEILLGFLQRGNLDGDALLYCPCEQSEEDFKLKYKARHPNTAHAADDPDRFRYPSARDLYYPAGVFSPQAMEAGLESFFAESQHSGPRNVRATAEMVWALETIPGIEHLMVYESLLNNFIAGKPWVSVCLYNVTKFSGKTIMGVLRTHPYTTSGGAIVENPFYRRPEEWLAENAPNFLPAAEVNAG